MQTVKLLKWVSRRKKLPVDKTFIVRGKKASRLVSPDWQKRKEGLVAASPPWE